MDLDVIIHRASPEPWTEGDNIPWNALDFSERMLKEHLSQDHDAASRRTATIERHVAFIHQQILSGKTSRILDLGCGPGLYAMRLQKLGHSVHGIDFSPASIRYARQQAEQADLECTYDLSDLRAADYGTGLDLVMLIFGEFNVFRPKHVQTILNKAWNALKPGGILLLEPSWDASIRAIGSRSRTWQARKSGLFSPRPHLLLEEAFWSEEHRAATMRYFVIDAETGSVTRWAASYQSYSQEELADLLGESGFDHICFYPSLTGEDEPNSEFFAVTARRAEG